MSRYTGPKARINRRLGAMIFESAGAVRAFEKRPKPPGMAPPPRKLSTYGEALREKQKIKYYYGMGERTLRRIYQEAQRSPGNTGQNLLLFCERRLDSVVRLAGLTKSRPQARQGVGHGHFLVNGRKTDIPSMLLRAGDIVHVKRQPHLTQMYGGMANEYNEYAGRVPDWLTLDLEQLQVTVARLPSLDEITLPVNVGIVIELLSR